MSWHWKSPSTFPALFSNTIAQAIAQPEEQVILDSYQTKSSAKAHAEKFRWYLWCIRSRPDHSGGMAKQINGYDLRTQIKTDEVGFVLWLRARADKLSEFERLNPDLAAELRE